MAGFKNNSPGCGCKCGGGGTSLPGCSCTGTPAVITHRSDIYGYIPAGTPGGPAETHTTRFAPLTYYPSRPTYLAAVPSTSATTGPGYYSDILTTDGGGNPLGPGQTQVIMLFCSGTAWKAYLSSGNSGTYSSPNLYGTASYTIGTGANTCSPFNLYVDLTSYPGGHRGGFEYAFYPG